MSAAVRPPDMLAIASGWLAAGETVAMATVLRTWGSSPCPPGSRLVLTRSGRMAGSVSGGCIESEVAALAEEVMDRGGVRLAAFSVSEERAWTVGLACGGEVEVMIEAVAPA